MINNDVATRDDRLTLTTASRSPALLPLLNEIISALQQPIFLTKLLLA